MTGLQKQFRNLVLVVFSVHLAGNLLLIPVWGITGAALTSMVTTSALNLWTLLYIRRRYGQTVGYFPSFGRSAPVR
jgi:O-antigen/teichoic acid export membrane protein